MFRVSEYGGAAQSYLNAARPRSYTPTLMMHLAHENQTHRYHCYIQCDPTLAESVAVLQPPWQVGIVRKVLDGLKHEDNGRLDGETSEHSSCEDNSSLEEDNHHDAATGGRRNNNQHGSTAVGTAGQGGGTAADIEEELEDGEEEDQFEVDGPPNDSRGRVFSSASRAATRSRNLGGGGTTAGVVVGDEIPATTGLAATPIDPPVATAKRKGARVPADKTGGVGGALGLPQVPDKLKVGVESRLEETCDAFRTSIRRAVLNYVLLDAGQRDRLGTYARRARASDSRSSSSCVWPSFATCRINSTPTKIMLSGGGRIPCGL